MKRFSPLGSEAVRLNNDISVSAKLLPETFGFGLVREINEIGIDYRPA